MTARKSDYDTVLQWFVDLQTKAEKRAAKVFIDGEPSYEQSPFYGSNGVSIYFKNSDSCTPYFYDGEFWNATLPNLKKDFKERFTLWKKIA